MNHGILLRADGTINTWTWGETTGPNPIEWPLQLGDKLLDLSALSEDDVLALIDSARKLRGTSSSLFLSSFPHILLPTLPTPSFNHVMSWQPGYRRIVHRPTSEWHDKETLARIKANKRIMQGEEPAMVIDEEFGHLTKDEKSARKGMKTADAPFPLTPMVRLVEMVRTNKNGEQTVETLRQFPFHTPVAEF